LALFVILSGCGAFDPPPARRVARPNPATAPVNTGLNALARNPGSAAKMLPPPDPMAPTKEGDLATLAAQSAIDLQKMLESQPPEQPARDSAPLNAAPAHPSSSGLNALTSQTPSGAAAPASLGDPKPVPDQVIKAPDPALVAPPIADSSATGDALLRVAGQMATLLREPASPGRARISDAVALASIESITPGALADLESAGSPLAALSAQDRQTLLEARERTLAQPEVAAEVLSKSLHKLSPPPSLKITRHALCSRVAAYGRFSPLPSDTFMVGQPIKAIMYAEVDGFVSRPARDGDPLQPSFGMSEQVSVELSQSLTLYHDPSGLQAWHRPPKAVVETSRGKRRDFYLIQQFELPKTLTIGRYNLKVTIRDKTSGSEAEAVMPINVVADPALTGLNRTARPAR